MLTSTDDIVPQANDVEHVAAAVLAVAAGCHTADEIGDALDMCVRQGNYYAAAATRLGLLEKGDLGDGVGWTATTAGNRFANLHAAGSGRLADELAATLLSDPFVVTAGEEGGYDELAADWSFTLGESTVRRRLATIRAWRSFVDAHADAVGKVDAAVTAVMARAPQIAAERAARLEELARKAEQDAPRYCSTCCMQLRPAEVAGDVEHVCL